MRAGGRSPQASAGRAAAKVNVHDLVLAALIIVPLLVLLLPLLPYPGDHATVMKVWFRGDGMRIARKFSLPMSQGVCAEIRYVIADRDSATGIYTKIGC
ncbi:MAG TPA: hypothetical protein VH020_11795 [Stellaceae bacterium]|jgi:hypothetical protein|nr:hypothetical protein [Stellaceae bacterium]